MSKTVQIIGTALAIALSACGSHSKEGSSKLSAMHRKVIPLSAGEYLVKLETNEPCSPSEFSVRQNWQYPDQHVAKNPVIELGKNKQTGDNKIRAAVCTPGKSYGWTVVKLDDEGAVTADWGNVEIVSVESIQTKLLKYSTDAITLDPNFSYIVDVEMAAKCVNQKVTLNGNYEYSDAADRTEALDKKIFTSATLVTDNLFHRAICKVPAVNTASEYVQAAGHPMRVTAAGEISGFTKTAARLITNRTKVALGGSEESDIEVTGDDGNRLMMAMEELGVKDVDPMYGATNLIMTNLRCDKNTADSSRKIRCSYEAMNPKKRSNETFSGIEGVVSNAIFEILETNGAAVPAGINPTYQAVGAKKVVCSRPVIPNPMASCTLTRM